MRHGGDDNRRAATTVLIDALLSEILMPPRQPRIELPISRT